MTVEDVKRKNQGRQREGHKEERRAKNLATQSKKELCE
jgi:hypothetical protein